MKSECCVIYTVQTAENITPTVSIGIPSDFEKVEMEIHSDDTIHIGEMHSPRHVMSSLDDKQNYSRKARKIQRGRMLEKVNKKH